MANAPYIVSNRNTTAIIPKVAATSPRADTRIHFLTRSTVSARTRAAIDSSRSAKRTGSSSTPVRLIRGANTGIFRPSPCHPGNTGSVEVDDGTIGNLKDQCFGSGIIGQVLTRNYKHDYGLTVE
jgi:hypothetical protein